ncbi:MAG: hypothetical protein AAGF50_02455 [Pseudomonadota bacterium]
MARAFWKDFSAALAVTVVGATLAWILSGGLPPIGIDDAAITRSYAENLARGAGYVYNVGGERVEGSTTLLWALILTGAYLVTPTPEFIILSFCGLLTFSAVYASFRLIRLLADSLNGSGDVAVGVAAVALLASPGYFVWGVWSMMELALWSATVIWILLHLVIQIERAGTARLLQALALPALALPLIRPEGVAVAFGLIGLAMLLAPAFRRQGVVALVLVLVSFGAVTAFRVVYFGKPFPNTFYAKVSSDTMQGLTDGLKYLASFLLGAPFVEILIVGWAAAVGWCVFRLRDHAPGSRGLAVVAAAVFGFLAVYTVLGGDHFALWRFYAPIIPLLSVPAALFAALTLPYLVGARVSMYYATLLPAIAALFATGWLHYYQARFDIRKEYTLVARGLGFGHFLSGFKPLPSIGVGPAGGIALAYDGHIYDLLGLNWTEMAHANPVKVGMRNHASFDKPTFWAHQPDVIATFNVPCLEGTQRFGMRAAASPLDAFAGLFYERRFQEEYVPVLFQSEGQCWPGFARPAWLDTVGDQSGVQAVAWSDVQIRN